jgi:hypothetical protein
VFLQVRVLLPDDIRQCVYGASLVRSVPDVLCFSLVRSDEVQGGFRYDCDVQKTMREGACELHAVLSKGISCERRPANPSLPGTLVQHGHAVSLCHECVLLHKRRSVATMLQSKRPAGRIPSTVHVPARAPARAVYVPVWH